MSRLPTGMTVESPGQGCCHTMRNVPDPGKEGKTPSQPQQIDRGLSEKNKKAPSRGVNGADHLAVLTPCVRLRRICLSVRPVGKILAVGLRPNTSGTVCAQQPARSMPSSCAFHLDGPGTSLKKRAFQDCRALRQPAAGFRPVCSSSDSIFAAVPAGVCSSNAVRQSWLHVRMTLL